MRIVVARSRGTGVSRYFSPFPARTRRTVPASVATTSFGVTSRTSWDQATARAEGEREAFLGVGSNLEQRLHFGLTEPDLHVVSFLVLLKIHGVRLASKPDGNPG
ncbi:hypothetical protein [Natronobeatus ordinarius]|uniref:hypothetical protein n=1 Tax=Natronobeatus ordinarius TaxID=2963433 RepID=UPI0020CB8BA0|nr:hypothetical protein [Natronobeatus ordinarius]